MKEFCCDVMEEFCSQKNKFIDYDPSVRSYMFYLADDSHGTRQIMRYCFWCGSKLPKDLSEEWEYILKKEYGLEKPGRLPPNTKKIPPEFKTDEWWKKRGL